MLDYNKTYEICKAFYGDCVAFWMHEGKDALEAHKCALMDMEGIASNPYDPCGEMLDPEAKEKFYRQYA